MYKIYVYFLLVVGLVILPSYIMSNAGPAITRKKALQIGGDFGKFKNILLRRFWIIHILNTFVMSAVIIFVIETWNGNPAILNIIFIAVFICSVALSGVLVSIPAYIVVKHWKR